MMKTFLDACNIIMVAGLLMLSGCAAGRKTALVKYAMDKAAVQAKLLLQNTEAIRQNDPSLVSPRTIEKGRLKLVSSRDWTSGFFPGVLWILYNYSGDTGWKDAAMKYTGLIEREKFNGGTHDMGFKIYCSFGQGYKLTNDPHYSDVIIQSAKTLSTRFNKVAGVIRSWDHHEDEWSYPVIVDNMMNLELLFAATQLTGDSSFYRIAVSHADKTMENHFRPDNSSFHVVDYDTTTGKIIKRTTHQGYANSSSWARGQAWGLYGFTLCYRFTKDARYLEQAEKIAGFILQHPRLPADGIPYWDFDAPGIPNEERDVSAAAIIASALLELKQYSANGVAYENMANSMLQALYSNYTAPAGSNEGFILMHSVGAKPLKSEIDVPLNYADYYYLEAMMRLKTGKL